MTMCGVSATSTCPYPPRQLRHDHPYLVVENNITKPCEKFLVLSQMNWKSIEALDMVSCQCWERQLRECNIAVCGGGVVLVVLVGTVPRDTTRAFRKPRAFCRSLVLTRSTSTFLRPPGLIDLKRVIELNLHRTTASWRYALLETGHISRQTRSLRMHMKRIRGKNLSKFKTRLSERKRRTWSDHVPRKCFLAHFMYHWMY
jgi:hypothetical protein